MKKLAYIDALRGFAIILVIIIHSSQCGINNYGDLMTKIVSKANYGVQLFYIASAFTIFLSYSNRINKERFPARNFFIRRFFRIAPLFYVAIIYYLWQGNSWSDKFPDSCYTSTLSHFFFLHGFSPYWINSIVPGGWSIAVEMLFYLLVPVFFHLIKNANSAVYFFIASILLQFTLNFILNQYPLTIETAVWERYLYYYLPNQLPVFALGIILFQLIQYKSIKAITEPLIFLSVSILMFVQYYLEIKFIPDFVFISGSFVLFAYYLSTQEKSLFINPLITYIGKISYGMYLVHFAVLEFMIKLQITDILNEGNHYTLNFIIRLSLVTTISILISSFLYYTIEQPIQKIGRKIIENRENRQKFSKLKY